MSSSTWCGVKSSKHPREWEWSECRELIGQRRRNHLLDSEKLLQLLGNPSPTEFRTHFDYALAEMIAKDQTKREDRWTESLAVGSQKFAVEIAPKVRNRQQTQSVQEGNAWILKEDYGSFFVPKK